MATTERVLPEGVARLCHLCTPYEITSLTEHSCTVVTMGLELRFQKRLPDFEWEWDEIVGEAMVHVEQMSGASYWMGLDTAEGRVCVDIGSASGRAAVRMNGWSE